MSTTVSSTASTSSAASAAVLHAGDTSAPMTSLNEVQPLTNIFVPLETIQPGDWHVSTLLLSSFLLSIAKDSL